MFRDSALAAWAHLLPRASLATLAVPDRWQPTADVDVLVATCATEVVGFVCLRASADEDAGPTVGEIDACYTHASVWGQGAGRALLVAAAARLATSGYEQATLWTERRNDRARRFYESAGWILDGTERRRVFDGVELVELRYRLVLR